MRASFTAGAIASALLLSAGTAMAADQPSRLFITGDSLIDAGNVWYGTGFRVPPASQGFFQGRFTNGPAWTDLISDRLYGSYTRPFAVGGTNYAVGGARAAADALVPVPGGGTFVLQGLPTQLGWYAAQNGPVVDPTATYIISFGNNDASAIRNGQTYTTDAAGNIVPLTAAEYTALFVDNIVSASAFALNGGARVFVGGVPKPDDAISLALQAALDAALDPLSAAYGDRLIRYSYANTFAAMRADPTAFGLSATMNFGTGPLDNCLAARAAGIARTCRDYFSFDGTHPTAQVHQALARDVAPIFGLVAVPEPATWAMLIIGFGAVGLTARRRRAHDVTAPAATTTG